MNDAKLKTLVDEVAAATGYSGLYMGTMYGKFALDVAKRAVLAERDACAKACASVQIGYEQRGLDYYEYSLGAESCAEQIRERSNA